jgi:membrane protein DedA with SNARE-associated domain
LGGNKLVKKMKKKSNIEKHEKKHNRLLDKFGWSAIFFAAWIPIIGDLILISAGVKKMEFRKFTMFMVSGKIIKTIIVVIGLGTIF